MKNSTPSSEFEHEDKCPSCGSPCNIHTDLDANDNCNECRDQIDTLEMGQIIPKEEPFKHQCEVLSKEYIMENRSNAYEFIDFDKKETIEEVVERLYPIKYQSYMDGEIDINYEERKGFIQGYNLSQQQNKNLYSEEDLDMFRKFMIQEQNFSKSCLDVFIEQFKKK